jgi:hypothetical protein
MADEYFVEIDGPDGLKHHVGPFKTRLEAEEWIAQHSSEADARQSEPVLPVRNNVVVFRPWRVESADGLLKQKQHPKALLS